MFTGLIESVGVVKNISSSRIEIETKLDNIVKGESIAVNGVCLTVISVCGYGFVADYSPNTCRITALQKLKKNSRVNLERALRFSSRLGGHIVSGHVDGIAKVKEIEKLKQFYRIMFSCNENITKYCVDKGSVAIDGISLTLSSVSALEFEVFVIPETFDSTTMRFKRLGDEVNIETDVFAKYIEKFTNKKTSGVKFEMLKKNGFA
ncbi:MAG: riboflavin synthase [Endomicrobium sp.]|jgi:riboflavin synthase|nr:riboflavin synthase [Endomicrobium sp.]